MPFIRARYEKLPKAYEILKEMGHQGFGGEDVSAFGRQAVAQMLDERMDSVIDSYLAEMEARGEQDRRNGRYIRHLMSGMGDLEVHVPRTRTFSAHAVLGRYMRRTKEVDRAILGCFLLGHSTRKVAKALLPMLGERISASTVSAIAKTLDGAVAAFHQRSLAGKKYRALVLDGVVLSRKTGAGALKRPVLVVLGLLPDGRKEVIDFRLAGSESEPEWEQFLTDLIRRGLTGEGVELIAVDGGKGLLAALPTVYPGIPVQRCWAHKTRNLTDRVRKADREKVKKSLRPIYQANSERKARQAAGTFARKWERPYPEVVRSLRNDLDQLLAFFVFKDPKWRKWTRTTNAIERRFREVRRRTRPMGVFTDKTSMDRILFAVFSQENQNQKTSPLFLLTQNS
jgi:transposase-like protein